MSITFQPDNRPKRERYKTFSLDFFICFTSFVLLQLNSVYGMAAIIGFMLPWVFVVIHKRPLVQQSIVRNWPLLLLPLLAGISTAWSDDPHWTLKASIELLITVLIGIMAGSCVKSNALITGLMSSLLVIALICILPIWRSLISFQHIYISGILGSKNAFSDLMALYLLVSIAVLVDRHQSKLFRTTAILSLICAPPLLYLGQSLGSILAVIMTMMIYAITMFARRMSSGLRILILFSLCIFVLMTISLTVMTETSSADILTFMGKDASLTGRTYLWSHAVQYIAERPITGTGYGAFWRIENPRAQELWFQSHVPPGAGFNFHNEYLEALVELGIPGLLLLIGYLTAIGKKAYRSIFSSLRREQYFAFILYIFYVIRTPVEVRLFGQFGIGMILLCVLWIYLKPARPEQEKPKPQNLLYVPPPPKIHGM